ncbi:MAG: PEP-CTERM sorting domain-containing protein [Nitrospirales bacterium]|nr:PEP-CTERM sorting domain-containing protein [Nitrospirales bacterium]
MEKNYKLVSSIVGVGYFGSYLIALFIIGGINPTYGASIRLFSADIGGFEEPNQHVCLIESNANSSTCTSGPGVTSVGSPEVHGGVGFGTASANIVTGELNAKVTAAGANDFQLVNVAPVGQAEISENFQVSGNGTVEALMQVSGSWNVSSFQSATQFQIQSRLSLMNIANPATQRTDGIALNQGNASFSGSLNQQLSLLFPVVDGQTYQIGGFLLTQILGGTKGFIDFGNTAEFMLNPSSGVSLTFSDPDFLTDPSFGKSTPVPEPSTILLFGTGLVGVAGWRIWQAGVLSKS